MWELLFLGNQNKKISILYVDQAVAFGGSLIVIGHIIDALDKNKFRPVVVAELDESTLKNHIKHDVPIYIKRRIYNYMHWMKTVKIIKKIPGKHLRKIVKYLCYGIQSLVNSAYIFSLIRVVIDEKIDLIHVNNGMNNFAPILVSILLKRKFIVHCHGIEYLDSKQRFVIEKVPKFIIISEFLKKKMIANHIPEDRMAVIPNPVKTKEIPPHKVEALCKRYNIRKQDLVFGIVGRMMRWKGHIELLMAAKIVLRALPEAKLVIVGGASDGDTKNLKDITKLVDDSGFKDRIIFTGYMPDVSVFYKIIDVCVHCSIEPEPFGLVITEAMSYGVPVIASDLGAPKEIITDGENGFIVSPTETEKLAETIIKLLTDEDLRKRLGRNGKQHVESVYQLEAYGRSIEKVYLDVLGDE